MSDNQAWLSNKKWTNNNITSNAKIGHYFFWGFAIFWNALCAPVLLDYESILRDIPDEPIKAAIFLFPLIGIYLIVMAIKATMQWRKFGPTPLQLDPFPGSLGGHVGGSVDTNIAYSMSHQCSVALSCIHSYMSGSGKNRSRRESVKWQSDGMCQAESTAKGSRYIFRFNVPDDLPASDVNVSNSYILWRVTLHIELEGADYTRQFEIPVFATSEHSIGIHRGTEDHHATLEQASAGVESIANIKSIPGGVEVWFPAFQRPALGVMMCLFGLVFAGIGIGIRFSDAPLILPIVFTLVGVLILLAGLHYLGKALWVSVTSKEIKSRRFLFGVPITTKRILASEFAEFIIKQSGSMQSGTKNTVFHQIYAKGRNKKMPVAERLTSRAEAELLKECFETYLS